MPGIRISPRAIIRRENRYLVVRCRDHIGDWYVFPGGGQHHGEDLHQTLRREVEEEIGIRPSVGELRFVRECIAARIADGNLPPDFHQLEIFFDCQIASDPLPAGAVPDTNQQGVEWRTIDELRCLRFFPQAILGALTDSKSIYLGAC